MFPHHKKSPVPVIFLILAGIFLGLLFPSPALADVGVRPILPGGSDIQPEGQTPIQMAAELVTISVRQASELDNSILQLNPEAYGMQFQSVWYNYVAEVQADFTMHNPTTQTISLEAWFPLASTLQSVSWELNPDEIVPRIASFQVSVGSTALNYTTSQLPNPKGADKPQLPWASFPVSFAAGADTQIHVSYLLPLTQSVKGSELALYYIFQTGAGWAGAIGRAELVINLPYPASEGTLARVLPDNFSVPYSMPDIASVVPSGAVMEGNQARWIWTNFEPTAQDDFSAWLIDPLQYQQLQAYLAAVGQNPDDGISWLKLANAYRLLATTAYDRPSIFATSYLSDGEAAYQKAAELLPDYPAPHTGMALLALSQYLARAEAPPEIMQRIFDELNIARQLETLHPELVQEGEGTIPSSLVDEALDWYNIQVTATAQSAANSTASAKRTESAGQSLTPAVTTTPEPSITPSTLPTASPLPPSSTQAAKAVTEPESVLGGKQLEIILPMSGVLIVLLVVICLGRKGFMRR